MLALQLVGLDDVYTDIAPTAPNFRVAGTSNVNPTGTTMGTLIPDQDRLALEALRKEQSTILAKALSGIALTAAEYAKLLELLPAGTVARWHEKEKVWWLYYPVGKSIVIPSIPTTTTVTTAVTASTATTTTSPTTSTTTATMPTSTSTTTTATTPTTTSSIVPATSSPTTAAAIISPSTATTTSTATRLSLGGYQDLRVLCGMPIQVLTDGLPNVRVMGEQTTPPPGTTPGENIKAFYKKAWFWGILLGVGALGAGTVMYYRRRQLPAYW